MARTHAKAIVELRFAVSQFATNSLLHTDKTIIYHELESETHLEIDIAATAARLQSSSNACIVHRIDFDPFPSRRPAPGRIEPVRKTLEVLRPVST